MAAPLIDPYVADLERENEALIEALREALAREAVAESERDQLADRVQALEFEIAWNEHSRIELQEQLHLEQRRHMHTHARAERLTALLNHATATDEQER